MIIKFNAAFGEVESFCIDCSIYVQIKVKLAALDEPDSGSAPTTLPCTLEVRTQGLVKLLFDKDMFNYALKDMEIGR